MSAKSAALETSSIDLASLATSGSSAVSGFLVSQTTGILVAVVRIYKEQYGTAG